VKADSNAAHNFLDDLQVAVLLNAERIEEIQD